MEMEEEEEEEAAPPGVLCNQHLENSWKEEEDEEQQEEEEECVFVVHMCCFSRWDVFDLSTVQIRDRELHHHHHHHHHPVCVVGVYLVLGAGSASGSSPANKKTPPLGANMELSERGKLTDARDGRRKLHFQSVRRKLLFRVNVSETARWFGSFCRPPTSGLFLRLLLSDSP